MVQAANLFLVGMMGAGKSTIGRLLARRMKRPFFDSDLEIEQRCGVSVPVIFDIEGEPGFRAREAQMIAELAELEGIILATGGGVVLDAESRRRLATRGTVVYLHAPPADLHERVRHDKNRPLLATADPLAKLEALYAERDPLYREAAHFQIETGRPSVPTLVNMVVMQLELAGVLPARP